MRMASRSRRHCQRAARCCDETASDAGGDWRRRAGEREVIGRYADCAGVRWRLRSRAGAVEPADATLAAWPVQRERASAIRGARIPQWASEPGVDARAE